MAFQAVPDTASITIEYLSQSKQMVNTLHAELPGGYVLSDLLALASAVDVAVDANWLPQQAAGSSYVQTVVRGLALENDQEVTNDTSAGPGEIVANGVSGNVTLSVKRASNFTGRSARGRLYWIAMPNTKLGGNENLVTQAYADSVESAVDAIRVAIDATDWQAVIVSRFSGGVERTTGVTFDWTNTSIVNLSVDSQRGRLEA